jgi:hypothetical protein
MTTQNGSAALDATLAIARELRDRVSAIDDAIDTAMGTAHRLQEQVEHMRFPRFDSAIAHEADAIVAELDGSSGSAFDVDRLVADTRELVELFELASSER